MTATSRRVGLDVDFLPSIGLAITTIGRPEISRLLQLAAESTVPPTAMAIASQSGRPLDHLLTPASLSVRTVSSGGGISARRNDAVLALAGLVEVLGFPTTTACSRHTAWDGGPPFRPPPLRRRGRGHVAGLPRPRFTLPPPDRLSVRRAAEPATFVRTRVFEAHGGFRTHLGSGGPSPWQSGEGTHLLLRLIEQGFTALSQPDIAVLGRARAGN